MLLRYTNSEGKTVEIQIGTKPIVLGRAPEADVVIPSEKASRFHCSVMQWDDDFVVKDLKSRNGTYLNDERVEIAMLRPGDRLAVGSVVLSVDRHSTKGATTILKEVGEEMSGGKGYSTMLREIVGAAPARPKDKKKPAPPP
jgi:pSer/pThr/pTyr-binding forkhead associated (FHA) protein